MSAPEQDHADAEGKWFVCPVCSRVHHGDTSFCPNTGQRIQAESAPSVPGDPSAAAAQKIQPARTRPVAGLVIILSVIGIVTIVGLLIWPFHVIKVGTTGQYPTPTIRATHAQTKRPTRSPRQTDTPGSGQGVTPAGDPGIFTGDTMRQDIENGLEFLETYAVESYDDASYAGNHYTYTASLGYDTRVLFSYGWCTTTEEILDQNFENITFGFSINGRVIPASSANDYQWELEDRVCRLYGFELANWPYGEHHLEIAVTFETMINDGWSDYPAGTFTHEFTVYAGE